MVINWFPGHMKKTLESLKDMTKKVDGAIYVLDARAPFSCLNPQIDKIIEHKPVLYVVNKIDLINNVQENKIRKIMVSDGKKALFLQGNSTKNKKIIISALEDLLAEKLKSKREKGVEPLIKLMVIGSPNTGKSTIINTLYGEKKAKTSDKAGVTKSNQWVKISDNFAMLDTPGTLWPKLEDQKIAFNLALIGCIKKEVLDEDELGFEYIKFMIQNHKDLLTERYKITDFDAEPIEVYDQILKNCGLLTKGGVIDYTKGAVRVLEDFRSGRIGRICLDL